MYPYQLTATLFSVALAAGFLGSLTGLGGGVILTPVLTLLLGVDLRYAIGATLVSVIATSSGAAAAYVREGYSNLRIGMLLEIATTAGAIVGATIAGYVSTQVLAVIFGLVLLHSAWLSSTQPADHPEPDRIDPLAQKLRLDGCYPTSQGLSCYHVQHVGAGFSLMLVAGVLSGLLGIGSGALKVIAMDRAMRIPFKVSTTTSNFMIGVTAAASAGIYLNRGYIDPLLAMPVMLGVLAGSMFGARVLGKASPRILRIVFAVLVGLMAVQMIVGGLRGKI
ncbi:MAG TPA: sulfite exporter TauE/SafE family protein [Candidatus Acidoferrum sp.]|nr:sulfite exporter TauE/SafE family protein [Candidatus Acidoferrum sp.]